MANRRMFSLDIVDTDAFLEMPQSSQLLYFHLSMRADDEGFVSSPKRIMKMIGSSEDDYKVLCAKKFIIPFESGICVIKHWLIHNTIRMDRFKDTTYVDEKNQLLIKDNKAYKLIPIPENAQLGLDWQPNGNQMATQVKLSKVKLSKVNIDIACYGEFNNVNLNDDDYKKLEEKFGINNTKIIIEELSTYMASKGKRYSNHYATLLNWGKRKVQDYQNNNKPKRTIA